MITNTVVVRKSSVRKLIGMKRLPKYFRVFVAGCWLYDILKANRLHKRITLWDRNYWVRCRSLDTKRLTLRW